MSDLKAQISALIKAKQYPAAIILLEKDGSPASLVVVERIRQRMKAAALAEVEVKTPPEPVNKPSGRGRLSIMGIVLASAKVGFVVAVIFAVMTVGSFVINYPKNEARIGVSLYCGFWRDNDCPPDYSYQVMAQYEPTVMACYHRWEYPKYEALYYDCLEDAGI